MALKSGDIWVFYKYEKLSNFCYDCSRLGHDSNACKFVSKEVGRHSGYGPNLRTNTAKGTGLSIEHYQTRHQNFLHCRRKDLEQQPKVTTASGRDGSSTPNQ
ncbi:hypothetical protein ACSBR2_018378 [Camellia fascicularis]